MRYTLINVYMWLLRCSLVHSIIALFNDSRISGCVRFAWLILAARRCYICTLSQTGIIFGHKLTILLFYSSGYIRTFACLYMSELRGEPETPTWISGASRPSHPGGPETSGIGWVSGPLRSRRLVNHKAEKLLLPMR